MKIEFEDGVSSYSNGEYLRVNDGKPFDVDARFAEQLLGSGYFRKYEAPKEEAPKSESKKEGKK